MRGRKIRTWLAAVAFGSLLSVYAGVGEPCDHSSSGVAPNYTIIVAEGQPVELREESLKVELKAVKDGRCPSGVRCIWAGHAAVTLQVTKEGSPSETVIIGTEAPPAMKLPLEATYGDYRLSLVSLEPGKSIEAVALSVYRATIRISRP